MSFCQQCLEKQRKIDQLIEENQRLKAQLRYRQRKVTEGPFGSSTPSAQRPVKPNTEADNRAKSGGGQNGHPGRGRKSIDPAQAARVIEINVERICPECAGPLEDKGWRQRSVLEIPAPSPQPILYRLKNGYCPRCQRSLQAQAPAVLPKTLLGNQLTAHVLCLHYLNGIPLGRICDQLALEIGSLIHLLHRMARFFKPVLPRLIEQYRQAPVRHADETGWRTDGQNGYAWLYCTPTLSLFLFRSTRSAAVPKEVLGIKPLDGVLVVDRYNGYNRVPCKLQYCYAHLLREVEDLAKEFPDQAEVSAFTSTLIPLLSSAMYLRSQPLSAVQYSEEAAQIQLAIVSTCQQPAQHFAIRRIQDIFCEHSQRLYHWVSDRKVPADNNRCERELRPTVIARKVSFGSQSQDGAKTREILMSVLHTLKKRRPNVEQYLKGVLDQLALDPKQDPFPLLFPPDTS